MKNGKRKKPYSKLQPLPSTEAGRVAQIRSSQCPGPPISRPIIAASSLPKGALLAAETNRRFPRGGSSDVIKLRGSRAAYLLFPRADAPSLPARQRLLLTAREPRSRGWHKQRGGCKTPSAYGAEGTGNIAVKRQQWQYLAGSQGNTGSTRIRRLRYIMC